LPRRYREHKTISLASTSEIHLDKYLFERFSIKVQCKQIIFNEFLEIRISSFFLALLLSSPSLVRPAFSLLFLFFLILAVFPLSFLPFFSVFLSLSISLQLFFFHFLGVFLFFTFPFLSFSNLSYLSSPIKGLVLTSIFFLSINSPRPCLFLLVSIQFLSYPRLSTIFPLSPIFPLSSSIHGLPPLSTSFPSAILPIN